MRLWVQTYSNTAVAPSAMLSVAAHVVLLGAAVYGSGPRPDRPEEAESSRVFYLLPPDRIPRTESTAEHLEFIEVGAAAALRAPSSATSGAPGAPPSQPATRDGSLGLDMKNSAAQSPVESTDSVYSMLSVEESAVRNEGSAAPVYPREMLEKGVEGEVLTRYVIDTTGRADSASLQILSTTNPAFAQAVREALPGMRFSPAVVQGHKVRQLVEQNFDFRLLTAPTVPAEHTRAKPVP
ncbi:MAG TPA: energy transducer TonB [Gemmatimonadaceae bacterium]